MNNFKMLNVLEPVKLSEHRGRGDYESFVCRYEERQMLVNMDMFLFAKPWPLRTRPHLRDEDTVRWAVILQFQADGIISKFFVTKLEFLRVFGESFDDTEGFKWLDTEKELK